MNDMIIWNISMAHGEVVERDREKKRVKRVGAVGDGFSRRRVAAGGRH